MKGDTVIVRCWGNEAAVMRVWEELEGGVCVVAPSEFDAMEAGQSELYPICFRRRDVFRYEETYYVVSGAETISTGCHPTRQVGGCVNYPIPILGPYMAKTSQKGPHPMSSSQPNHDSLQQVHELNRLFLTHLHARVRGDRRLLRVAGRRPATAAARERRVDRGDRCIPARVVRSEARGTAFVHVRPSAKPRRRRPVRSRPHDSAVRVDAEPAKHLPSAFAARPRCARDSAFACAAVDRLAAARAFPRARAVRVCGPRLDLERARQRDAPRSAPATHADRAATGLGRDWPARRAGRA